MLTFVYCLTFFLLFWFIFKQLLLFYFVLDYYCVCRGNYKTNLSDNNMNFHAFQYVSLKL